jgi:hypothetical protein
MDWFTDVVYGTNILIHLIILLDFLQLRNAFYLILSVALFQYFVTVRSVPSTIVMNVFVLLQKFKRKRNESHSTIF